MSTQPRKKCCSSTGRHQWQHSRNKIVRTQTLKTVQLSEKGVYNCTVCKMTKFGAPVYQATAEKEGGAA